MGAAFRALLKPWPAAYISVRRTGMNSMSCGFRALAALVLTLPLASGGARPAARGAAFARRAADVVCADRAAGDARGRHRLGGKDGRQPQSADGRPVLPALLRRSAVRRSARAALARLRRHRRGRRPRGHQQPRDRRRRPGEGDARRQARVSGRRGAEGPAHRSRRAPRQGRQGAVPGAGVRAIPTSFWSATWCSPSAIRSASARP